MIWIVQEETLYAPKAEPFSDLASTECKVVRTERRANLFVNWLVQKDKLYGEKGEAFCDLVSREG